MASNNNNCDVLIKQIVDNEFSDTSLIMEEGEVQLTPPINETPTRTPTKDGSPRKITPTKVSTPTSIHELWSTPKKDEPELMSPTIKINLKLTPGKVSQLTPIKELMSPIKVVTSERRTPSKARRCTTHSPASPSPNKWNSGNNLSPIKPVKVIMTNYSCRSPSDWFNESDNDNEDNNNSLNSNSSYNGHHYQRHHRYNKYQVDVITKPPDIDPYATRTLYIGSLDPVVTEDELKSIFSKFGTIRSIFKKIVGSSRPTTFAFIQFDDLIEAFKAKRALNGHLRLGKFNCYIGYGKQCSTSKVWIGNLCDNLDTLILYQEADRFGAIKKLIHYKYKNGATIQFESINGAEACKECLRGIKFPLSNLKHGLVTDFDDPDPINTSFGSNNDENCDENINRDAKFSVGVSPISSASEKDANNNSFNNRSSSASSVAEKDVWSIKETPIITAKDIKDATRLDANERSLASRSSSLASLGKRSATEDVDDGPRTPPGEPPPCRRPSFIERSRSGSLASRGRSLTPTSYSSRSNVGRQLDANINSVSSDGYNEPSAVSGSRVYYNGHGPQEPSSALPSNDVASRKRKNSFSYSLYKRSLLSRSRSPSTTSSVHSFHEKDERYSRSPSYHSSSASLHHHHPDDHHYRSSPRPLSSDVRSSRSSYHSASRSPQRMIVSRRGTRSPSYHSPLINNHYEDDYEYKRRHYDDHY